EKSWADDGGGHCVWQSTGPRWDDETARCRTVHSQVRQGAGDRSRSHGTAIASASENRSFRHDPVFRTALGERRGPAGMALAASDARCQGRTIESGTCGLAEETPGAFQV